MAYIVADRVEETTNTSGTGSIALTGAVTGYRRFSVVMAIGDTCHYCITDIVTNDWEIGTGTYTATNTLARTILESSSTGSLINLAGNTNTLVFLSATANSLSATQAINDNSTRIATTAYATQKSYIFSLIFG